LGRSTHGQQLFEETAKLPLSIHEASFQYPRALLAVRVERPQMTLSMKLVGHLIACNQFMLLAAYCPPSTILPWILLSSTQAAEAYPSASIRLLI
jgi:hypothetical protein